MGKRIRYAAAVGLGLSLLVSGCSDDGATPAHETGTRDGGLDKKVSPDQKGLTPDQKGLTPDQKGLTPDQHVLPPDQNVLPPDQHVLPPDQHVLPPDQHVLPPDQHLLPLDKYVPLPDAASGCVPFSGTIGKRCKKGTDCGTGYTCLLTNSTDGVCTVACTPDNEATPLVNEDTCPQASSPTGAICGNVLLTSGSYQNYCFKKCQPRYGCQSCAAGMACEPSSAAFADTFGTAVCLYQGCNYDSDCKETTGKRCASTAQCNLGETCLPWVTGGTAGVCAKDGVCDVASGLCKPVGGASGDVGDPCQGDTDCGPGMTCNLEYDEAMDLGLLEKGDPCTSHDQCCAGFCNPLTSKCSNGPDCQVQNRNGYCTITGCKHEATLAGTSCPPGSECNNIYYGGACQASCDLKTASTCRGNPGDYLGDYECRDWSNVVLGGVAMTKGAVCERGSSLVCFSMSSYSGVCAAVGDSVNATNMDCRDLHNQVLSNPKSAAGFCLDDTAAGPVMP